MKTEIIERYENGNIAYVETRMEISPMWLPLYPNHRIADDGTRWIRTGINKKFAPDGKLRWEIKYDDCGNMVKF